MTGLACRADGSRRSTAPRDHGHCERREGILAGRPRDRRNTPTGGPPSKAEALSESGSVGSSNIVSASVAMASPARSPRACAPPPARQRACRRRCRGSLREPGPEYRSGRPVWGVRRPEDEHLAHCGRATSSMSSNWNRRSVACIASASGAVGIVDERLCADRRYRDPSRRSRRGDGAPPRSRRTSRCGRLEPEDQPLAASRRLRSQPCRQPRSPRCDRPRDQCRRRRRRRVQPTRSSGSRTTWSRASAGRVDHVEIQACVGEPTPVTNHSDTDTRLSATVSDSTSPS